MNSYYFYKRRGIKIKIVSWIFLFLFFISFSLALEINPQDPTVSIIEITKDPLFPSVNIKPQERISINQTNFFNVTNITGNINIFDQNLNTTSNVTFNQVNASMFNGLFNWTTADTWNSFNGFRLDFNETKFNESTINLVNESYVLRSGDLMTGPLNITYFGTGLWVSDDARIGDDLSVMSDIFIGGAGTGGHKIQLKGTADQILEFVDSSTNNFWELQFLDVGASNTDDFLMYYWNGTQINVFQHNTTSDETILFRTARFKSDVIVEDNVSAEWFNGKFNFTTTGNYLSFNNGYNLTFNEDLLNSTINDLATDTQKNTSGPYLYNDSTTIYFNDTFNNETILAISKEVPKEFDGNDLTGSDGDIGRQLFLDKVKKVSVDGLMLSNNTHYTFGGGTLTFNIRIWNDQLIIVWDG